MSPAGIVAMPMEAVMRSMGRVWRNFGAPTTGGPVTHLVRTMAWDCQRGDSVGPRKGGSRES